ncbi:MAG: tyrosine--tRNA ligase [Candidatus Woesearchaeota archaeon]
MDFQEKLELIKQVGEEILTEEELIELLKTKKKIVAYDGFEPSGKIHIAQGLVRAQNIKKLMNADIDFVLFVADWFAYINNKLGSNMENIKTAGEYFIETWKACGVDVDKIKVKWASDNIKDPEYWNKVINIAKNTTINRVTRCAEIMGRTEKEAQYSSMIFYPCMQAADIFYLDVDIAQLGMDQRKVNVLAREVAPKFGWKKPVAIHHHMLMGLGEPPKDIEGAEKAIALKMSKSKPDTAIFMTDSPQEVEKKIKNAYCPANKVSENPIIEYCKYIIFENYDKLEIKRPEKFGGDITVKNFGELIQLYSQGKIHPLDLKNSVAEKINELLDPVRKHFKKGKAKKLLEKVESFEVTR